MTENEPLRLAFDGSLSAVRLSREGRWLAATALTQAIACHARQFTPASHLQYVRRALT
jgi:hypothetical protein